VLQLGNALMEGGNKRVQERVFDFMTKNSDNFFKKIRSIIQDSTTRIRDQYASATQICKDRLGDEFIQLITEVESVVCVDDLLRFIQQTCEGHFLPCQKYWQEQTNAPKSYNIIAEVVEFISVMIQLGINSATIKFVTQAIQTLIETLQGPCIENQLFIASSAMPSLCMTILEQESFPGCKDNKQKLVADLKEMSALLMSSLLEGCVDAKIPKMLTQKLNFDRLMRILKDVNVFRLKVEDDDNSSQADLTLLEERLQTAYEIFILMRRLGEFDPDTAQQIDKRLNSTSKSIPKEEKETVKFFMSNTASIEINQKGQLQRVVFRIPEVCRYLSLSSKEELMRGVDRSTPGTKLTGVLDSLRDLYYEMMQQQQQLKGNPFFKLRSYDHLVRKVNFVVALALNLIMLATWELDDQGKPNFRYDWVDRTVIGLGVVVTVITAITMAVYLLQHGRVYVRKQLREAAGYTDDELEKLGTNFKIVCLSTYFILTNPQTLFEFIKLAFGLAGIFHHRFFFCVFVLDIVNLNLQLRGVTKSITSNGNSLILTGLLIAVVIYIYAGIGFLNFSSHFVSDDGQALCKTLWQCTVVSVNGGLRNGDINGVMDGAEWGAGEIILFKFTFFVIVVLLLLNVITGIVLDTFAELRQEAIDTEESLTNYCFVCSIDRQTFDRFGEGFEAHIKKDHSLWKYVYFLVSTIYLRDPTSHTGPETYVAALVREQNVDFFPISQAIVLRESQEKEAQEKQALEKGIQKLGTKVDTRLDALTEQLKALSETVTGLATRANN